jgi:hypothetical protein
MHAAVLTFPGHLFQTVLSVRSLQLHYPEIEHFSFVLDDVEKTPWQDYEQDFVEQISAESTRPFDIFRTSDLTLIKTCVAGWWRQQLVKCCLDQILSGDAWFVVDGDCVFETRCEVRQRVPITRRHSRDSRFSIMSKRYVRTLLGIRQGHLEDQGDWVCTNAVPFRLLDRPLLEQLRDHVQQRCHKEFVELHLDWFRDQNIVADHDPPDRMTMSEWELIECFRRYVQGQFWPFADIGSGYSMHIDRGAIAQQQDVFRHAYQWDAEIGQARFEALGVAAPDTVWQHCVQWHEHQRSRGNRA